MHRNHPGIPFERYADDAICHCSSEEQAAALRVALENRFAECGLTLHPEKTKIVYCKDDDRRGDYPNQKFDFLGYTFRPRLARRRAGKIGVSFSPAVSNKALKAIRQTVRRWSLQERSDKSLDDLARMFNAHIRGWINYYGRFYPSALYPTLRHIDVILARWACRKFKALYRHRTRAIHWLERIARRQTRSVRPLEPALWPRPNNGSRMTRECHVRFCESAGVRSPRATHRNIYVRSRRAGERVMASVSRFLAGKLRLKVNEAKSAVARPEERKFLGFSIANDGSERRIAPKALATVQDADPGHDPPDPGDQSVAGDRRAHAIPDRMARLLRLLPDPAGTHETGSVDPPKTTHRIFGGSGGTGTTASRNSAAVACQSSEQRSPPVRRRVSGACQDTRRSNRPCATITSTHSVFPNSMFPPKFNPVEPPWYVTRMPGGVGGAAP